MFRMSLIMWIAKRFMLLYLKILSWLSKMVTSLIFLEPTSLFVKV